MRAILKSAYVMLAIVSMCASGTALAAGNSSDTAASSDQSTASSISATIDPGMPNPIVIIDPGPLFGDVNQDGGLDFDDLIMLLSHWGNCPVWSELTCEGDLNQDYVVNEGDLLLLMRLMQQWQSLHSEPDGADRHAS
jgi:hypothetical protein